MADFKQLGTLPQPRRVADLTPEAQHFQNFKPTWKQQEPSRVVAIDFSTSQPYSLAVVSGTKVGLWNASKEQSVVSKFKDLTQCVAWRSDGKLMMAGEASGSCAVVEVEGRNVLRRFRGHGDAVTCCAFATADRSKAATGCRDGKLRVWDVATSDLLHTVEAHTDCMKVLTAGPGGPESWITAGHDGKVHHWDLSAEGGAQKPVVTVDHGCAIEDGVAFPGGRLFATVGGTSVKVWDLMAGGKLVHSVTDAHAKTITAVSLNSSASMLLTASFDGFAKVFQAATMEHMFSYRLSGPATCAVWRPDETAFAVGLDDGSWQLRELRANAAAAQAGGAVEAEEDNMFEAPKPKKEVAEPPKKKKKMSEHSRFRGGNKRADSDDEVVMPERPIKKKQTALDNFLRKFEYRKALEHMMDPCQDLPVCLAGVDELLQRGVLEATLTEIGSELCLATLKKLHRIVGTGDALQQQLFMECLHTLLDRNQCLQPPTTADLVAEVEKIEQKIQKELKVQAVLLQTTGMLKNVTAL